MKLHICPIVEEVWHPVHVPTRGVQETDLSVLNTMVNPESSHVKVDASVISVDLT